MPTERDITIDETREHYRRVQQALRLEQGTEDAREDARDVLDALDSDLSYIIGDRGFEEFVAEKLTEYRKEIDESTALCSCWRATCPIKQGEVPPAIRQHGSAVTGRREPSELVTEYLQRHEGGEALSLIQQEWGEMVVHVHLRLADAHEALRNATAMPDDDEVRRNLGLDADDDDAMAPDDGGPTAEQPAADD